MSGTHTDLLSDPPTVYASIRHDGHLEGRLPTAVALLFIAGSSWVLWMLVLQGWRVLSGL